MKKAARVLLRGRGGLGWRIPAMTDFRARGTIMGPTGLTAVFGMGTGVTPSVWSPERRPADVFQSAGRDSLVRSYHYVSRGSVQDSTTRSLLFGSASHCIAGRLGSGPSPAFVEEGRSGWSSRLAVRTGRLRRSPVVHARPIDLVVFQEPSHEIVLEAWSWRGLRA